MYHQMDHHFWMAKTLSRTNSISGDICPEHPNAKPPVCGTIKVQRMYRYLQSGQTKEYFCINCVLEKNEKNNKKCIKIK